MTMAEMRAMVEKTIATKISKDRFTIDDEINIHLNGKYTITELTFISLTFAHYKSYVTVAKVQEQKFVTPPTHTGKGF